MGKTIHFAMFPERCTRCILLDQMRHKKTTMVGWRMWGSVVGDCSAVYVYIHDVVIVKIDLGVGHLQPFVNQAALCFFGASLSVKFNRMGLELEP